MHAFDPYNIPMTMLRFMGVDEPDEVRARVYGGGDGTDEDEQARRSFVAELAGPGVIDCPAYDAWIAELNARGWLAPMAKEPNPEGEGKIGRWRLNDKGREEWANIQRGG